MYAQTFFYSRKFIGRGFIPLSRGPFCSVPFTILHVSTWQGPCPLCSFSWKKITPWGAWLTRLAGQWGSWNKHTSAQAVSHPAVRVQWTSDLFGSLVLLPPLGISSDSLWGLLQFWKDIQEALSVAVDASQQGSLIGECYFFFFLYHLSFYCVH